MTTPVTREDLVALADREGIHLQAAGNAIELAILVGNALYRLPANQRGHAKLLTMAALLDRSPERIDAMMRVLFPQEARHV